MEKPSRLRGEEGCYACAVRCKRAVEVPSGPYATSRKYGGPEYETLGSLGSLLCIDDLAVISCKISLDKQKQPPYSFTHQTQYLIKIKKMGRRKSIAGFDVSKIDRDTWLRSVFPEWGTYLNEEIDETVVPEGKFSMWWLGCTGIWLKTPGDANIAVDYWTQRGIDTKARQPFEEVKDQQIVRMTGALGRPPFLRCSPQVMDPFAITKLDAVLATHIHRDHICPFVAAAACRQTDAVFIGPIMAGDIWESWGVPRSRIVRLKPGDEYRIKDTTIKALNSFDRTILITPPPGGDLRGKLPQSMDDRAVNYLIQTPAGSVYHSGDSHFSNGYFKHGRDHEVDICFVSYGQNGPGITDKVPASDCLRIAQNLKAKLLIPIHYDLWSAQMPDPHELALLHDFNKHWMKFKLFIWKVGGQFVWPDDQDVLWYNYPKGGEDFYTNEPNWPFPTFL